MLVMLKEVQPWESLRVLVLSIDKTNSLEKYKFIPFILILSSPAILEPADRISFGQKGIMLHNIIHQCSCGTVLLGLFF